jgi:hypothetical protein
MPFLDVVKSILNLEPPKPTLKLVVVNSSDNYEELPFGFFNVETASGRKSLGYRGGFVCFDVGETVVDGKRVTLDKKRDELPTVKLDYRSQSTNVVNGHSIVEIDTDRGEVSWTGAPPSSGVQLR